MDRQGPGPFALVAMPPSGEVFVVEDGVGQLWMCSPHVREPERIEADVLSRAIADHGFERVDRAFESWSELDAERHRLAGLAFPSVQLDVDSFDRVDVERVLRSAGRFRDRGQVARARRIAYRLLETPIVWRDHELRHELIRFLQDMEGTTAPVPETVTDPRKRAARERVMPLAA